MPSLARTSGPVPLDNAGLPRCADGRLPSSAAAAPDGGFAASGDNFRTVGLWRVLSGNGWRRWQLCAQAAELAASRCAKDSITAARQMREQKAKRIQQTGLAGDAGD